MESKEIWKDICGYDGEYRVSNLGRIYSVKSNLIMKQKHNHNGYLTIGFKSSGTHKRYFVHVLVLSAFVGKPSELHECNHKNSIRDFNELSNLEWVTKSENAIHGYKSGNRKVQSPQLGRTGIKSLLSKKVSQFDLSGNFIKYFDGVSEAERITGISNISAVCLGKRKKAGGFIWKFKN
jgi:hypothetical protein